MKSFTEYLTESKRVYEFKIKIAGDCPKDCATKIKEALATFKVDSCSKGKGIPIAESHEDFPTLKNVGVTIFDVCLAYPATSLQVKSAVGTCLKVSESQVCVRNLKEQEELVINHQNDKKSGESLLSKEYTEDSNGQKLVGEKHTMSMLKELNKVGHRGLTQYKGVNDEILAKSVPAEKAKKKGK